jgi:putative spermidine/putrescine transport system ATP-binding protein
MASIELTVTGLVKRYSPQVVVGPLSFEVREGEFFSLLGPSGCGKTTTLRCIAGFETPSAGQIMLNGKRLDATPPHRRDVGLVFQSYALFPHLTVFDNVAFGLRLRRLGKAEIEARVGSILDLVGLPELAGRYPAQLSGGQQQRVAIARSTVLEPRLILFDEPLSNLDFKLRVQMRSELRELQRRLGKTSIYVTHDQSEALALSDRIAVLSQGRIEQIGSPVEIYETPETAFVADFIGRSNLIEATVVAKAATAIELRAGSGLELRAASVDEPVGTDLLVLVRPEHIRLAVEADTVAPNRFAAEIAEITYLGNDVQLRVKPERGGELLVSLTGGKAVRRLQRGDVVWLVIDPDDLHALRR